MENTSENTRSFYQRFIGSKAFYPIVLSLIAALCVSIWAINRTNRMFTTTVSYSQTNPFTLGDTEPTTLVQNTTAKATTQKQTSEAATYAYESNQAFKGEWVMPLVGEIGKDFSAGKLFKSETMGDYRVHNGVDIQAKPGTKVLAVNSGKVLEVYNDAFWGNVIVVDHGGGVVAKYCSLGKETAVEKGQLVEKGTVLGTLGTIPCEQKDESHLHLEIAVNGEVKDPIAVMNLASVKE